MIRKEAWFVLHKAFGIGLIRVRVECNELPLCISYGVLPDSIDWFVFKW